MARVAGFVILGGIIVFAILFSYTWVTGEFQFVRGQYGKKCYPAAHMNQNIKFPQYFTSMGKCLASILK